MIALAPSKRRSRWRSRKAGCPARTRSPSHTPSPSTKPESNTDTTARSRGTSSPPTQIRMRSLRGSSSKSCVPCAMGRTLWAGGVLLELIRHAAMHLALHHHAALCSPGDELRRQRPEQRDEPHREEKQRCGDFPARPVVADVRDSIGPLLDDVVARAREPGLVVVDPLAQCLI